MLPFLQKHWYPILLVVVMFTVDQFTKLLVIQNLRIGESWPREGFFRFTHVVNSGSALGLFGNQNFLLTIAAFLGVAVLIYFYRSQPNPSWLVKTSLALMLAGALGNLTDRLNHGHVTDFIDVGPWYIFNIADSCIVTGVIMLAASMLLMRPHQDDDLVDEQPAPTEASVDEPSAR